MTILTARMSSPMITHTLYKFLMRCTMQAVYARLKGENESFGQILVSLAIQETSHVLDIYLSPHALNRVKRVSKYVFSS